MATATLEFVSETCGGAHIGRRRACGVCSIQKKKCVRIPENPLLCENCKKRNLETCPPPSIQKGKLADLLALIGRQANVDETVATGSPVSRTSSRRPDEIDHSNERTLVPTSYTVSGHQTSYSSATASVTENAADTNQKGFVDYVNVLPDICYSQAFTGPICNVHAHNTVKERPVSYTDDSQQMNLRHDFAATGAYVQGTYSRDVPLDCSGDDLSQAFHQLYQMDYESYISPEMPSLALPFTGYITSDTDVSISPNYAVDRTCANVVGFGDYYDMWLQTEPSYPSYSLGSTGDNYGNSHQASLVSGTPAAHDMRLNEIDDSYEEVVQMLRNIQWFPD